MAHKNSKLTEREYHAHDNNFDGYCTACYEFTDGGVESDAEGYECENCGEMAVMGVFQALLIGALLIVD